MKYQIEIEINQAEKQIKVHGEYEPSAFLSMCMSQTLQIIEEDLKQGKEYKKLMRDKTKKKNPGFDARLNDLAKAVQELTRIVEIYDTAMWHINERLENGEKLEDIIDPSKEPPSTALSVVKG